ncbi:unnamed protein product [Caenorhabditis angaria]|uniref:Peptidase S54 rhomboid domain-containing protein n=1 Tax=Caenorhabditis angaria TaxID=860376 RepID=A0A9P1IFG8_9PELO|nr:unnamed protein product [Caenorhabditis angaria]
MAETLLEAQFQEEKDILKNLKKHANFWILSPNQQKNSENSGSYLMPLVLLYILIDIIQFLPHLEIHFDIYFFLNLWYSLSRILIILLFGIPLEIAHGTIKIYIFFTISFFYSQYIQQLLKPLRFVIDIEPACYALLVLHLTNLIQNWPKIKNIYAKCGEFYKNHAQEHVEKWEPIIKKNLSGAVLSSDQQIHAFNSRPYFMVLVTIYQTIFFFENYHIYDFVCNIHNETWWSILMRAQGLGLIIYPLVLGIPLEVAHGTLQIGIFYIISIIYTSLLREILTEHPFFFDILPATFSLLSLYAINIILNWRNFSYLIARVALILILALPFEFYEVYHLITGKQSMDFLYVYTCDLGGCLIGALLGYFWIYRKKQTQTDATIPIINYFIFFGSLIAFILIAKFSGIHD